MFEQGSGYLLKMYFVLCLLVVIGAVVANVEYRGHKVYRIELETQAQQDNLSQLTSDLIDFLVRPSFKYGVVGQAMVPPSHFNWFEEKLEELGIVREIAIEDVYQHLMESEVKQREKRSYSDEKQNIFDIRRYHRYEDILNYLRSLEEIYNTPALRVELVEYGVTHEERPLVYLKISHVDTEVPTVQKPVIVVEAGINPREWITVPASLNVVEKLLIEQIQLNDYDWIVIPVANPDGYEYTHTNLRLWTKSRSTKSHLGHICPGVNINRNFDVDWQNFESSSSPCSYLFSGIEPFSEIETRMIQSIINDNQSRIRLYLSLQNNGGFVSYPWNYERAASGMIRQHHLLGLEMIKAMNENYNLDVGSTIFDRASGTSCDYARSNGILYTYNIDIVQKEGVIIPEEDIHDIVDDVWRAVVVAASQMVFPSNI